MSKSSFDLGLALQEAMAQDGGRAVFRHYGFEPSRKAQAINPFRDERTVSFYVIEKFGKVIFKDFGDDTYKGDCRKFVQLYEKVDYAQAFKILCGIYGLGNFSKSKPKSKPKAKPKQKSAPKKKSHFQRKLTEIQFKDFSKEELAFWKNKGQIDLATLEANRVQSVKSFKIEIAEGKYREYPNLSFVFAYEIVPNQAYKLYMPKPAYRVYAPAKTIFLPNLEAARESIEANYAYSFGLENLRKNENLILCAGEPDCLALKAAGYNAFTLGDERSSIPEFVQDQLKAQGFTSLKKSISVLYDTDYAGIKAANALKEKEGYQSLSLPKLTQQKESTDPKPKENDVCDYLQKFTWDHDLRLVLGQHRFQNQDYTLYNVPTFSVKKYLSERSELLAAFLAKHRQVQIDADAGIGKTYSILANIAQKLEQPILFAVPFAIQVDQIEKEYSDQVKDLVCFSNNALKKIDEEELAVFGQPTGKVNVCTYDRIKSVAEKLIQEEKKDFIVVIDESHLLTSEYGYRTRAIRDVLQVSENAYKSVYLSATPDYALCKFSNYQLIRFKREINPVIKVRAFDYEGDRKKNLLKLLLQAHKLETSSSEKISIVRLNNKTLAKVVARLLIEKGLYREEEIDFVFSEKQKGLSTRSKESIIQEAHIPEPVRLLFVTACFDCGINIQNTNIDKVISFETRHTDNCKDTLKQLIARFRSLDKLSVWVCKPKSLQSYPPLNSKERLYQQLAQDAKSKLALLPYNEIHYKKAMEQRLTDIDRYGLNTPRTPKYIKANPDISAIYKLLSKDEEKNNYKVNYNYIRFTLKDYERRKLNSNTFYQDLAKELPNLELLNRETLNIHPSDKDSRLLQEMVQKERDLKKVRIHWICQLLQEQPQEFFDAVHAAYRDVALKEKIKRIFSVSPINKAPKLEQLLKTLITKKEDATTAERFAAHHFDEEITILSHRYFFLHDLLIPRGKIPHLLEKFFSDGNYGLLSKTLMNHINLFAKKEVNQNLPLLIQDTRKLEDIHWLEWMKEAVKDFKPRQYPQKKTAALKAKIQSLAYDLKILKYQSGNHLAQGLDYILKIQQGQKLRAKLRKTKQKINVLKNKIKRLNKQIENLKVKYKNSFTTGFEVNLLSNKLNALRSHRADHKGVMANIRLLSCFFDISTHKRQVFDSKAQGASQYTEKYILKIGKELSFQEVLLKLGFQTDEAKNYLEYLAYQIRLDCENHQKILSKNGQKTTDTPIVEYNTLHVEPVVKDTLKCNKFQIVENNYGYPAIWD